MSRLEYHAHSKINTQQRRLKFIYEISAFDSLLLAHFRYIDLLFNLFRHNEKALLLLLLAWYKQKRIIWGLLSKRSRRRHWKQNWWNFFVRWHKSLCSLINNFTQITASLPRSISSSFAIFFAICRDRFHIVWQQAKTFTLIFFCFSDE
jgi:hypothetical protein